MKLVVEISARLMLCVAIAAIVWPAASLAIESNAANDTGQRSREGTLLESHDGRFELDGDRVSFHSSDGQAPLKCLENLTLQRVAQQLAGIGRERQWSVTGTLTEFQGRNYLLVRRAVLKSRSVP